MTQITGLTVSSKQAFTLILQDGTQAPFYMEYVSGQQGWFFNVSYESFAATSRRLVVGINMLRQFRNIIPFGLACKTVDGYEPIFVSDFANGRAQLFLLNSTDIVTVESILNVN